MRRGFVLALAVSALGGAGAAFAQQANPDTSVQVAPQPGSGSLSSQILTIDTERFILESACGRRAAEEYATGIEGLTAENRRIEAELSAEEDELVSLRDTTNAQDFKALADAFDQKVEATKNDQLARERGLNDELTQGRAACLAAAEPALVQLMRRAGAAVILERRSVFYSVSFIDITDRAIALMDEITTSGEAAE